MAMKELEAERASAQKDIDSQASLLLYTHAGLLQRLIRFPDPRPLAGQGPVQGHHPEGPAFRLQPRVN